MFRQPATNRQYPQSATAQATGQALRKLALISLSASMLLFGTPYALYTVGQFLIVRDTLRPADALVPLAGDPERVQYAAVLLRQGVAQHMVITNMAIPYDVPPDQVYSTRTRREAIQYGVPAEQIVAATEPVATTYAEAQVLLRLVQQRGWRSLLVFTSPSHTRRARLIFREIFQGSNIRVTIHPIEGHWYTGTSWWRRADGWRETTQEYIKLALYFGGYHAGVVGTTRRDPAYLWYNPATK